MQHYRALSELQSSPWYGDQPLVAVAKSCDESFEAIHLSSVNILEPDFVKMIFLSCVKSGMTATALLLISVGRMNDEYSTCAQTPY